jgi:hypothetical protein
MVADIGDSGGEARWRDMPRIVGGFLRSSVWAVPPPGLGPLSWANPGSANPTP